MITWRKERTIGADLETVWRLFSEDRIQRVMPNVIEHRLVHKEAGMVGSRYLQTYQQGSRRETYTIQVLGYENSRDRKQLKLGFVLAKLFEIRFSVTLVKKEEERTLLIFEGQNKGVNVAGRTFLKLGGKKITQKVVDDFLGRVEREALKTTGQES
ncbi:SRPBCC family protein [Alteribacter aurantiacus]|uniref:SRPBCC family protein n=1 Tax=Alteribacter aurantiacus TaxID=254410 RepID=UPI000416F8BC|nr:SRPBCC family protein [Alteribacter aurantiacus]